MPRYRTAFFPLLAIVAAGCSAPARGEHPSAIQNLIDQISAEPAWNPPARIFSYSYHDRTVYYVPQHCCDFPSAVYDENGKQLCSPDGGITGRGDGKCPDFTEARRDEKLIWKDSR